MPPSITLGPGSCSRGLRLLICALTVYVTLTFSACDQEEQRPEDGNFPGPFACDDISTKEVTIEYDRYQDASYDHFIDRSYNGLLQNALREVCHEVTNSWEDGGNEHIPMYLGGPAEREIISKLVRDHYPSLHVILAWRSWVIEENALGISNYRESILDDNWYSFLLGGRIQDEAGGPGYTIASKKIGTFVTVHEIGHQRANLPHTCQDQDGNPSNGDEFFNNAQHDTAICVMASIYYQEFEYDPPDLGGATFFKLLSQCDATNPREAANLLEFVHFCSTCFSKISKEDL